MKIKMIYPKIFACPECKRRFAALNGLNLHLTRAHDSKYKVKLIVCTSSSARGKLQRKLGISK